MSDSKILLKTINELLTDEQNQSTKFWIPAYQRGYRWSSLQVTQLLGDILEFTRRRNPQPEEFYCLQPVVLKVTHDDSYEVVDGQQRLTTILLILRHFNERLADKYRQKLFTLDYETRPDLLSFLLEPTKSLADSNADFFHLYEAITSIEEWFSGKESVVDEIKTTLLNKTKVIWFQLSEKENPVDAFTRLNVGKIPLTNDELIRALFLKRSDAKESEAAARQFEIAHEWDQLEKALQNDAFWYFLNNQIKPRQNRIGFLFELIAKTDEMPEGIGDDAYGIFYAYSKKLKDDGIPPKSEWLKIKQLYMMLDEWFEDRTLFHIVGFLILQDVGVDKICSLSVQTTKNNFEQKLREEIFAKIGLGEKLSDLSVDELRNQVSEYLDDLKYGVHSNKIRSILLLFNLATLLDSHRSNLRFQFDSFKNENWDIEHVRSVTSIPLDRHHDRVEWLNLSLGYLNTQDIQVDLRSELESFVKLSQKEALDSDFEYLHEKVLKVFKENEEEDTDNGIFNLTLLDRNTNRSYKNAVFAVKRQRLLSLDQSGIFVPLCTRNVFLKCYSSQVDNVMFWGKADREAYRMVMIDTLVRFFCKDLEMLV